MSAVPKKKLCWQCEGNVAKDIDNCPYCGVYLQAEDLGEIEEDSVWKPSYRPSPNESEEIPSPIYQINSENEEKSEARKAAAREQEVREEPLIWNAIFAQLKQDLFPILFLMMGSIFFLFGIVLMLFSQNGTLTLQWQEKDGIYFFLFALPLIGFGWKYLQQISSNDS